jgi:hypothetical protein
MKKAEIIEAAKKQGVGHLVFKKDGVIRTMSPYYWRPKPEFTQEYKKNILKAFPNAEILNSGDEFKPFRGGAPVAKQSHIWIDFKIPS